VGGMSLGTLLTLFVVPVVYLLFARQGRVEHAPVPEPAAIA
jgi:Cu/Ag efflux pump CusA